MEVVLLEDVKALGKKGQIVKVNDGYARNFILPKKLGVEANTKNLNDLKLQKANEAKVAAEQLAEAKALAAKIDELSVTVSIKAGEGLLVAGGARVPIRDDFPKGALYDLWNTKPEEIAQLKRAHAFEKNAKRSQG